MRVSRRPILIASLWTGISRFGERTAAQQRSLSHSLPIGWPGRVPGDGFWIRHGYACENTWYNPGWWHAGEDWYALDGMQTAGARIYAVTGGDVVFVGSEYPGRVVIIEHPDGLFSMYGHLGHDVLVSEGDGVIGGQQLGTVYRRTDGSAPSHLHFEIRDFLFAEEVNGAAPRYDLPCGFQCAPGPGYWPIDAPEHPSEMGWRNPMHVIAGNLSTLPIPGALQVIVALGSSSSVLLQAKPFAQGGEHTVTELALTPGNRFRLLDVRTGDADSEGTSAEAYSVWYQIETPDGSSGWVSATSPSTAEVGGDDRPSALICDFLIEATAGS